MITNTFRRAIPVFALACVLLDAGCGSAPRPAGAAPVTRAAPLSLATSVTTASGAWAVALLGGSAAQHDNFWQLLVRPAGSGTWRLATPPGVASNGGLVVTPAGGRSLVAGFRPSQGLVFTPLATTADDGASWSGGVIDADLADAADALAADPGDGRLLALLASGSVELSADDGANWSAIATQRSINRTQPGSRCALESLTGVAFSATGIPLLAGTCAHRGVPGVFAFAHKRWQAAGLVLPSALGSQHISVLAVMTSSGGTQVLLEATSGTAGSLVAAWSGSGGGWSLSQPVPLQGRRVLSAAVGGNGTAGLVLAGGRGLVRTEPAGSWQWLPGLPRWTQTLAFGPGTQVEALAPRRASLAVWAYDRARGTWVKVQRMSVPVQFGSSS